MHATAALRNAARTPLIRFLGKRSTPKSVDHTPRVHPASPTGTLPDSFATYRAKAQQHGPLGRASFTSGGIGAMSGAALGPVRPAAGEFFDRAELPARFGRLSWTEAEIEAIESGGASMFA
ncbi:Ribosomal protein S36 mitochondrial [Penicillium sp. IBT 18751x]|nr:Ribosomal protein S36 mitochondrial [Penicillium sp. IBT 18751x]